MSKLNYDDSLQIGDIVFSKKSKNYILYRIVDIKQNQPTGNYVYNPRAYLEEAFNLDPTKKSSKGKSKRWGVDFKWLVRVNADLMDKLISAAEAVKNAVK